MLRPHHRKNAEFGKIGRTAKYLLDFFKFIGQYAELLGGFDGRVVHWVIFECVFYFLRKIFLFAIWQREIKVLGRESEFFEKIAHKMLSESKNPLILHPD